MSEVKLEVGGMFDIASGSDLAAMGDRIDKGFRLLSRRDPRPIIKPIPANVIQASAAGAPVWLNFGGPASGRGWFLRSLAALFDAFTVSLPVTVAVGTNAIGTLTLPPGASVGTLVLNFAGGAGGPVNASVTGAVTGTQTFSVTEAAGPTSQTVQLNLSPATPGTSIVVTVPALGVGSGAYTMTATITCPIAWFISQNGSNQAGVSELVLPGVFSVPMVNIPGDSDGLFVHFGEQVVAEVLGLPLGQAVTGIIRVNEYIDTAEEAGRM